MNSKPTPPVPPAKSTPVREPAKGRQISLGPVTNLEEHVSGEWWRSIFNSLYLKTDGDVVEDTVLTAREVDLFIKNLSLEPTHRILDLCCGQGRHAIELARRGYSAVEGMDQSRYLIQRARANSKKAGLNIKWREGDARKLPYPTDSFDFVLILGNSFGYFESIQDDIIILREAFRILKPWGRILIDVTDGDYMREHYDPRSWEWIDKNHFVCRERSLSHDRQKLISREVITHAHKGIIADQFYAERLYNQEGLNSLLTEAGFSDNKPMEDTIQTESRRNQDLGMMQRRFIMTGVVRKEWSAKRAVSTKAKKNITVLFGDPNIFDKVKPNGVFDDDDIYTIDRLKEGLYSLNEYCFQFLSSHDSMIEDLKKAVGKTDMVLNLCDEGFGNVAEKELHVPALLEMLKLPYSGSGPQCLAHCYDKSLVRGIAKEMNIPVPEAFFIKPNDSAFEISSGFPVIVKPNFGDSSFGITQNSIAENMTDLIEAIGQIRERIGYEKPILVEEFLPANDLSIGFIGNYPEEYLILPITEEDYSELPPELPRICGYEAKWDTGSPYMKIKTIPAEISEDTKNSIISWSLSLIERLECRDYVRLDWRIDKNGIPKLLEVNPNPGWCWDGHLAKQCHIAGIAYSEMLGKIVAAAINRHAKIASGLQPT